MLVLSGVVAVINFILSAVVGFRLLTLGMRTRRVPEISLGTYFLASAVIATAAMVAVYSGLGDPSLTLPLGVSRVLLAIAAYGLALGAAGVYVFTWTTFRPDRPWARWIVIAGISTLVFGLAWETIFEGFTPVVFAGWGHWIAWAGRTAAMFGVAFESFRYWSILRRRARLGLADPVITDRFLLWGLWASASCLNYVADLAGRLVYVFMTGTTTEMVPEALGPLVNTTVLVTMVLGVVSGATLFLTFFPTAGYRRWVETRGAVGMAR